MDDPLWFEAFEGDLESIGLGTDLLDLIQISETIPIEPLNYDTAFYPEEWPDSQSYMFFGNRYEPQSANLNDSVTLSNPPEQLPVEIPKVSGQSALLSNTSAKICIASSVLNNEHDSSKNATKRKFEDCLAEFACNPEKKTKRRKPFSPDRRREVDQVRKVGACIPCRLLKLKCKLDAPCLSCLKTCQEDLTLGRALCVRQKLLDVRFTSDLWNRRFDIDWLKEKVGPLRGQKTTMELSLASASDSQRFGSAKHYRIYAGGVDGLWSAAAPLQIEVQDFVPRRDCEGDYALDLLHSNLQTIITLDPEYLVIPTDRLPSLATLEAWVLDTTKCHRRAFVGGFRGSFLSFARRYYESKKELPMKNLMEKVVRLNCFHGIWCSGLPKPRTSSLEPRQYASKAVHKQIALIVSKEIIDLEIDILSTLQKHIFNSKGPGKGNMLPIWTCLWILILTYRQTIYLGKTDVASQLAQHMYNMLVSIYSSLFRPSSPLWLNFLKDDIFEQLFGRDPEITERLGNIKTEMLYTHKHDKSYEHPTDELLRLLIFEHEKELGKKLMEESPSYWCSMSKKFRRFPEKAFWVEGNKCISLARED